MRVTFAAFLSLSLLLVILFAGAVSISLKISQEYLARELREHAQDTATALSVVLKKPLITEDRVMVETMLRALVDRGQYSSMVVLRHNKKYVDIERGIRSTAGVPAWFIRILPMAVLPGRAEIFKGWQKIGQINIRSYPGAAYEQLWQIGKNILLLFGIVWLSAYILLAGVLFLLVRPLKQMERQAVQISSRNFVVNRKKPWFKEFATTVAALNLMSDTISQILADQALIIDNLRHQASRDPVTRLDIFEYFRHNDSEYTKHYPANGNITAILLQISGLGEINRRADRMLGDKIMRLLAYRFSHSCHILDPRGLVCRVAGAALFAIVKTIDIDELKRYLLSMMADLRKNLLCPADEILGVRAGAFFCDTMQSVAELHLQAEKVVETVGVPWQWRVQTIKELENNTLDRGEGIESLIKRKITSGNFELSPVQVTCLPENNMNHYELHLTLDDGRNGGLRAGLLLPVAERLGLLQTLDRRVMEKMPSLLRAEVKGLRYAVNISAVSLMDGGYQQWLIDKLRSLTEAQRGMLLIETTEALCALHDAADFAKIRQTIRELGCKFGFDHFGLYPEGLTMLPILRPDYVKIDRSLLIDINHDAGFGNLIRTLSASVHSLGIVCIAPLRKQDADRKAMLTALGVDGVVAPIAA
ncbi:LapD/MoxY N-terminal periplasmic domain-containing protein [Desulfobacterota bacterium M19]